MEYLKLNGIKDFILDLIFPKQCLGCARESSYLCSQCQKDIKLNQSSACVLCHRPSNSGLTCPDCRLDTSLKAIWVAADYNNNLVHDLIHSLKYNFIEDISQVLADLAARHLKQNNILHKFELVSENTVLVPVPLYKKRFLSRGFNQSDILAGEIAKIIGLPKVNLLKRIRNTATQINLKRTERQLNVKEAFKIAGNYTEYSTKKVILVDDVVTTGSTLKECAKALSDKGLKEIYGLVVAQRED